MIRGTTKYMFHSGGDLREFLASCVQSLKNEVESFEANYLLEVSENDLSASLFDKYELEFPIILDDQIHIQNRQETKVDVSQDHNRHIFDRNEQFFMKATAVTIAIPFKGDSRIFNYTPSTRTQTRPVGTIYQSEIQLFYEQIEHNSDELKQNYNSDLAQIKQYLNYAKPDVQGYNQQLQTSIISILKNRKDWLLNSIDMVSSLGIPILSRENVPQTYSIPNIRKKPQISLPKITSKEFAPEPTLASEDYENIISILGNMVLVMEKSPAVFTKLNEEEIRTHFLVQLNGQYKGNASGETFNGVGKTDILINIEGKNVFIAECKFWEGKKSLSSAIDQLLSYTCWRDTKTALIIFSRKKNFTNVLEQIVPIVESHI